MMRGVLGDRDSNTTVSSGHLEFHLDGCDAQTCIVASHSPSVHVYYALRSQLERSSPTWLQDFVCLGGLDSLLNSLGQMTGQTFTSFSDAILQIDCISCIRAILNTHLGIDCLLQSLTATNKLVMGLEISNTLPKKQILEMLAALCAHSPRSYQRIIEGLDHLKRETNQYHKFSVLINELKSAETLPHKTAVMTFINALISCNADLTQRCRTRNQMIGLTLLDVINFLQREETDDDLHIQLQTFHDQKHQDEQALCDKSEVDLSSPAELVEMLQSRVFGSSRMVSLVNILQDLLAIEMLEKDDKDRLWGIVEQQVHHLVHSDRLCARSLSSCTPRQVDDLLYEEIQTTQSLVSQVSETADNDSTLVSTTDNDHSLYENLCDKDTKPHIHAGNKKKSKMTEPDLIEDLNDLNHPALGVPNKENNVPLPARPERFPEMNVQPPRPSLPLIPLKVPEIFTHVTSRRGSWEGRSYHKGAKQSLFRTISVPFPSYPMRNLKWIKIQDGLVEASKGCVWEPREVIPRIEPDYQRLETLFAETRILGVNDEVALLPGDVRLKINLFLNRLEVEPDELVRNLIDREAGALTLPLLKYLHEIVPCRDEMLMLKQYNGSLLDIGMAEQFLLHLMDVPDYHTLLLGHLTRLQFSANISRLQMALRAMVSACQFLLNSQRLRDLLQLILRAGNFLNYGQFNGSALGVHLSSLKRLKDMHSIEPNHSVLHQVAVLVDESDERLFQLLLEIPKLEEAARHSPEEIRSDVTSLNAQLKQFVVQLASANPSITDIFHPFLEGVKKSFSDMQQSIAELRELSKRVAAYVCEPLTSFNLQTCLTDLLSFLKDLRKARHENSLFKRQRTQARRRSDQFKAKMKHKKLALEFGKDARASSSMMEDRKKVVERILSELHHGNFHPVVPSSELLTPEQEELPPTPSEKDTRDATEKVFDLLVPPPSKPSTAVEGSPERQKHLMELSHISVVGTPMINRPCSDSLDDDLFHLSPRRPGKGKVTTSSANDLLDEPDLQCPDPANPPQKVKHIQVDRVVAMSPPNHHHRSRSDLTDSILVQNKWVKYEELKQKEKKRREGFNAPLAVPESSMTLATLNLEDAFARRGGGNHLMRISTGPVLNVPQDTKDKKVDKKTGIGGFLSRLSRAVLKPRTSAANVEGNILQPAHSQDKRRNQLHYAEGMDKENCPVQLGDPKRSSKRLGRFRAQKYSA